jgi:hypothetical protein
MPLPDLSVIERNADSIVGEIGREAVDVYAFLADEFARGSVVGNYVFQFMYRSFYRLDNAGLTPEFKSRYFALLEESRNLREIDLRKLVEELHAILNRKGQQSLQFSFVTKLANMANRLYPIYDGEVAKAFGFRAPDNPGTLDVRLEKYMSFYAILRDIYSEILNRNLLQELRQTFRQVYAAPPERIPDIKVLDFIFWSAGKLGRVVGNPEANS